MDFTSLSSIGDSMDFDKDLSLSDKLKTFKSSKFDPEEFVTSRCRRMGEKEIRHLCTYLVDLKKASAEEMRKSVYANYPSFIRTSREISDLEGQLLALKNLLSNRANLVHGLGEGIGIHSLAASADTLVADDVVSTDNKVPSRVENWLAQFLETLEVLLAERRVDEALAALEEGERTVEESKNKKGFTNSSLMLLQTAIMEQRKKLADQLADAAKQYSISFVELRSVVQAIKRLGDGPRAHTMLLKTHSDKLQSNVQSLRPSGTLQGVAYTAGLSQLAFSTIAQAASDSLAIFNEEPTYVSELVTWAVKQTENLAHLVKRHVLDLPSASGNLRPVAESVQMCFGYCSLLEARGLALSPVLHAVFRPCVELALSANLKRIELSTGALVAADDWSLNYQPVGSRSLSTTSLTCAIASQPKLSSSAHKFNTMIQELCEDVSPLENMQLYDMALEGVLRAFNEYINTLISALPGSTETENLEGSSKIVRMAETEAQQLALLSNALMLADELLPRATTRLSSSSQQHFRASDRQNRFPEQRELKKKLQRMVDHLRDTFCRQQALELIFNEDGGVRLSADMYLCMDEVSEEPEWFPSQIYQELFQKLTYIANIASDMFVGRERFATILLIRLTESIILWLSDDQVFWEAVEQGERLLGPFGLRQFYLDMEFVILFASQGRYLSRNLHQVIKNIIGRAIEAVGASGVDPYSMLPEDEWFADVAQIAIKMLTGKANFGTTDTFGGSPTASMSARSVSSIHSHGSN